MNFHNIVINCFKENKKVKKLENVIIYIPKL